MNFCIIFLLLQHKQKEPVYFFTYVFIPIGYVLSFSQNATP